MELRYGLDESAVNTIAAKWLFRSVTKNGVPGDVRIAIKITFHFY